MTRLSPAPLAALALVLLTGCSAASEVTEAESPAPASSSAPAPGSGGATTEASMTEESLTEESVEEASAREAGVDPAQLGTPLAVHTVAATVEGDPKATVEVAFYGLRREGKAVIGTYSFAARSTKQVSQGLYHYLGDSEWRPSLVDPVNLRQHLPLEEADGDPLETFMGPTGRQLPSNGEPMYAYAVFAAPPEDVRALTAIIADGAPAVSNVPLR